MARLETFMGTPAVKFQQDENIFERVLDFIIELDPEVLTDEQLEEVSDILNDVELEGEDDFDLTEVKLANKTSNEKKRYVRKYYKRNRQRIKIKLRKFNRSSEGRKRMNTKDRLAKANKTPTGRRKVRYHRR
jgi:hypothetical protein